LRRRWRRRKVTLVRVISYSETILDGQAKKAAERRTKLVADRGYCLWLGCDRVEIGLRGPGFNFINVLRTAFTSADPERVKRY